jgi:hypothetical protein
VSTALTREVVTGASGPSSVRTNAGEGSLSRLDRRSTPGRLGLTAIPGGTIALPGKEYGLFAEMDGRVEPGLVVGHPCATGEGGTDWYGHSRGETT